MDTQPDYHAVFEENLGLIKRVIKFTCGKYHVFDEEAEDFSSFATLKIMEDDFAVLRKFKGNSKLKTYLTTVIRCLFLDFRVKKWGKWRPSAEARRQGATAIELERLMYREGYDFKQAVEILRTNHGINMSEAEWAHLAGRLPQRINRRPLSEEHIDYSIASEDNPHQELVDLEVRRKGNLASEVFNQALANLDSEDLLLLRLKYHKGESVARMAKMLGLSQKKLYPRIKQILASLRKKLVSSGLSQEEWNDALEVSGGFFSHSFEKNEKKAESHPSKTAEA